MFVYNGIGDPRLRKGQSKLAAAKYSPSSALDFC
jgi:hypothetical protein